MISTLDDVRAATVLLRDGAAGARGGASVTLQMSPGGVLGPETAAAVAGLVSSAVPGIEPGDVVVVDARDPAQTYRLAPDADVAHEGAALLRLRARVERALADKVRGFFAGMQIESVVVVSANLDLDRVRERMLELDPQQRGQVALVEERAPAGAPVPPASGATGTAVNAPAALPDAVGAGRARGESRRTESIVSYVTREIARSPRGLADVSASVVIFDRLVQRDGAWQYDASVKDDLPKYKELVAHALGLTEGRAIETRIQVTYLPSPWTSPPIGATAEPGAPVTYGAIAAVALAVLLVLVGIAGLRRRRSAPVTSAQAGDARAQAEAELPSVERLRREAARLVDEDVERAAAVLTRWLAREGGA